MRERFESYDDRVIYTTAFTLQKFFTEKSTGSFTMAVIAMPDELRGEHSMAKLSDYFRTGAEPGVEAAIASTYATSRGEWLKIERHPIAASTKVSGVLFYCVLSDRDILFVGLGTQPGDSWPPSLLKKLLPAVQKVVESIECTGGSSAAKPAGRQKG